MKTLWLACFTCGILGLGGCAGTPVDRYQAEQPVLALPVDGRVWNVDFDDWMYLIDDKVMLNRSAMRKFGFPLGDVTLSFTKR